MTAPTPSDDLGFTEYKRPYPEPKSVASFAQDMCTSWGFDNDMFASWPEVAS